MKEEDYFGSDSSEEFDAFSHDNRKQQYGSGTHEHVSSGHSMKSSGNRNAPVHRFRSSYYPGEDDERVTFSSREKLHVCRTSSHTHTHIQGDPCYARTVRNMNLEETWKLPIPRRKTRQQLQKEKEAAITIQSAWRGYQVRRDINQLDQAATRIQAAFRGYMTRKELPLGQYGCGIIPGQKRKKKMRNESRSFPELLNYFQQLGLAPGPQTGSQSIFLSSGKRRRYPKNIVENYTVLHPKVALLGINSAQRPHREMVTYGVLVPQIQKQRYQDAATTIQAAWRGYQIRQKARPTMLEGAKSLRKSFCSNFTIQKIYRKHTKSGHTLEQHEVRGIIAKSSTISFRNVPRVRNINIYALVKGMPASQRPSVSIRVSSPNAVVQGYQKDMSAGVHGLYTIKNHYSQRPSQILIHVNLQKEKDLKSCPYE